MNLFKKSQPKPAQETTQVPIRWVWIHYLTIKFNDGTEGKISRQVDTRDEESDIIKIRDLILAGEVKWVSIYHELNGKNGTVSEHYLLEEIKGLKFNAVLCEVPA